VDPVQFSERIREAVARYGKLQVVSRQTVETTLCSAEMADALPGGPQQTLLQLWLEEWERSHDWTLYVADADETEWTRRCIRHSDRVILLVDPSEDVTPWIQKTIQALAEDKGRSVLVLVHRDKVVVADTARWLERVRPETHLHYRVGVPADAGRVGRCLTGQAVGLVLGGGGARGFAHVGVVRAMRELGIPIDRVGGTSMGAIVGGLVAMDASHEEIVEASRQTFLVDRVQHELTLPIVALNASQKLDRAAQRTFRGTSVEDLPVSYFCVSCDLTAAEPVIHRSGPLWRATRASGCLPGVFVPVVQDGHLLVDGGIVDNLPGGIMREDCGTVIVVDVSPTVDMAMTRDAFPSAWALLRSRLNPLEQAIEVPSIVGMLTRAAMVASARVAEVTREHAELVVQPPIQEFGLLEFERMEHIVEVGYQHALDVLRVAIAEGPLKELLPASTGTIDGDQASAPRPPEADPSAPPRPPSA